MVDLLITYISWFLSLGYTIIIGKFPKKKQVNIWEILFKKKKILNWYNCRIRTFDMWFFMAKKQLYKMQVIF